MNERHCVSGCAVAGQHYASCQRVECPGCMPQPAKFGYLCPTCWHRLEQALVWWPEFSGAIVQCRRLVQRDTGGRRSRPDGFTPLAQTFLDVDEADRYLASITNAGGDALQWVSGRIGWAEDAAYFTRCAERAQRTHELVERDGKLRRWRCPNCHTTNPNELTLWLKQPKYVGDERVISCMNRCGYEVSMDRVGEIAAVESHAATQVA